jgi:purine-binding chemotaxis protein CheW
VTATLPSGFRACVFTTGDATFAVDVAAVREVAIVEELTPVPLAPPHVLGAANLRSEVLPIVDAGELLGTRGRSSGRKLRALVVSSSEGEVGVVVDEVVGLEVLEEIFAAPVPVGPSGELIIGRARRHDRPVTILDAAKVVAALRPVPARALVGDRS